ncbi:PIN domain nuclease [Streptodolium elevatio]|uniref:Ribonuclease VapC n=1 Tax=Streptodolium elevatio TaxID=3157996 RepID=A0ABV3DNU8_9ACTN
MTTSRYLVDKSALARWNRPAVGEVLSDLSHRGLLAVTGVVEYEVLYSARSLDEARRMRRLLSGFDYVHCGDEVWDRVREVQVRAIEKGFHRALSMADALIAAAAERHDLVVLHYDGDYDMIASITGQPTQWVVPAGQAD